MGDKHTRDFGDNVESGVRFKRGGRIYGEAGFVGANAAQMTSSAINTENHGKKLKTKINDCSSTRFAMVFFAEWMRQWGLKPAKMSQPEYSITEFRMVVDESFMAGKMALRSETLSEDQLEAIIKEATEAMQKQEEIVAMAHKRLEEMRRL